MSEDQLTHRDALNRIRDLARDAAIQFSNVEVRQNVLNQEAKNVRAAGFKMRDALTYRFDAVLYHLQLVAEEQAGAESRLQSDPSVAHERGFLRVVGLRQRFLFDDVVFNLCGFFDYLGRFAGLLLLGDENVKLRWDKTYKWAKHSNAGGTRANLIHGTETGDCIVSADEGWIRRFTALRSKVIHYESEKLDAALNLRWTSQGDKAATPDHRITPFVPRSFLRLLRLPDDPDRLPVRDAADLLVLKTFETCEEILEALIRDLQSRVPEIPDGVRWYHGSDPEND